MFCKFRRKVCRFRGPQLEYQQSTEAAVQEMGFLAKRTVAAGLRCHWARNVVNEYKTLLQRLARSLAQDG